MAMTNEEAHALSRKRGTSKLIYGTARVVLMPIAKLWYRFKVTGAEYVPKDGAAIIAPNHKSFYDSFFIGLATKRNLHFMAKTELFEGKSARMLSGLGAFPGPARHGRPGRAGDRPPAPRGRAACWPSSRRARASASPTR